MAKNRTQKKDGSKRNGEKDKDKYRKGILHMIRNDPWFDHP